MVRLTDVCYVPARYVLRVDITSTLRGERRDLLSARRGRRRGSRVAVREVVSGAGGGGVTRWDADSGQLANLLAPCGPLRSIRIIAKILAI